MKINIGSYLERIIRDSKYSKKDICNELNARYNFGSKPLSYTTFSTNLKEGNITINEAIGLATILDVDLNKIVNVYKNKYIQTVKKANEVKIEKVIVNILNNESLVKGIKYKEENVSQSDDINFECYHLSEDGNTVILQGVTLSHCFTEGMGYVIELAYFENFLDILGECDMSLKEFKELPLHEKISFLYDEGRSAMEILGEEGRSVEFELSKYFTKPEDSENMDAKTYPDDCDEDLDENLTMEKAERIMDDLCHSEADIVVNYIYAHKDEEEFASVINSDKYNGNVDKYADDVIYDWRSVAPFNMFAPEKFLLIPLG